MGRISVRPFYFGSRQSLVASRQLKAKANTSRQERQEIQRAPRFMAAAAAVERHFSFCYVDLPRLSGEKRFAEIHSNKEQGKRK